MLIWLITIPDGKRNTHLLPQSLSVNFQRYHINKRYIFHVACFLQKVLSWQDLFFLIKCYCRFSSLFVSENLLISCNFSSGNMAYLVLVEIASYTRWLAARWWLAAAQGSPTVIGWRDGDVDPVSQNMCFF